MSAPRRFNRTQTSTRNHFYNRPDYDNEKRFFETPPHPFQQNFRSRNWEEPRMFNNSWNNSPLTSRPQQNNFHREEQNYYYADSPIIYEETWERRVTYNRGRNHINFQRGNNRFTENYGGRGFNNSNNGNWRFSSTPRVKHSHFSPRFQRQNKVENRFMHDQNENNGYHNEGNNFESDFVDDSVNINHRNRENDNFHDDVFDRNNWFSFENEDVKDVQPRRGRGGKFRSNFNNASLNRGAHHEFRGKANHRSFGNNFFKKKFNRGRGQKKNIKLRFQRGLDDSEVETMARNDDEHFIVIDETFCDCKSDCKTETAEESVVVVDQVNSKENIEEILITD